MGLGGDPVVALKAARPPATFRLLSGAYPGENQMHQLGQSLDDLK